MGEFNKKVVWITGASSPTGEALALQFSDRNARLVLSDPSAVAASELRDRCVRPQDHLILPLDLEDTRSFADCTAEVVARLGRIDVLVNNVATPKPQVPADASGLWSPANEIQWSVMNMEFFGPVALLKSVLPYMLAKRSGHLMAIPPAPERVAPALRASTTAARYALVAFYDALRAQVQQAGVAVSVLESAELDPAELDPAEPAASRTGIAADQALLCDALAPSPDEWSQKHLFADIARTCFVQARHGAN